MSRLAYPVPPQLPLVEDHFGDEVADPYRPLEDGDDPGTVSWVRAENRLTEDYLSAIGAREEIRARITALWDYPKAGSPFERGGRWFQTRNSGLQSQSVLYTGDTVDAIDQVLIDPNTLSSDGTVSLTGLGISHDGTRMAYATSAAGSDWLTWRVRDTAIGVDGPDLVEWSKFSGAAWRPDGSGFYYVAFDRPAAGAEFVEETVGPRVRFHRVGTDQIDDTEVYSCADHPDWFPGAAVTDDGQHLIVTVQKGTGTETHVLVQALGDGDEPFVALTHPFAAKVEVIGNDGDDLFVLTDAGAERGRVMRAHLGVDPADWTLIIAESADTLIDVQLCGQRLVCHYLRHARSALVVHDMGGGLLHEITWPGMSSLEMGPHGSVEGRPGSHLIHFKTVSYTESGTIRAHDLDEASTEVVAAATAAIDADQYVTEQVRAESPDGTLIPMFITRRVDAEPTADAPVLLYGYGGFDISLTPAFSVMFAAWVDLGGLLAVANLRGGGEYGRTWHEGGRLANKQNVFDDFCSCARWLVRSGWSRPDRIAISGGSNGGLLVGACVTQHPELFGAAVADVGVFDMLRFHLWTIGRAWKSDYGNPENAEHYRWLRAYSPLHNVRPGSEFPPTLIMTGDHDDRVVPCHSYKFAAALQAAQSGDGPVLLRVESSAGHGLGKPTEKLIGEATDRLTFLVHALEFPGK